jgi:hypothetical protein
MYRRKSMNLFHYLPGKKLWLTLLLLVSLVFLAACSSNGGETTGIDNMNETEHEAGDDHGHEEGDNHEHQEGEEHEHGDRIPNNGASIRILAPADGASFAVGEEVIVEIAVENFDLRADGSHWHVYVDGASWGMIMGGDTDQALRGLEAGEHQIEVYLAGGDHVELEEGASITITVQ